VQFGHGHSIPKKPVFQYSLDDLEIPEWYNVHLDYKKKEVLLEKEIFKRGMPDCTDWRQQQHHTYRGYGIMVNLNKEELKFMNAVKQEK